MKLLLSGSISSLAVAVLIGGPTWAQESAQEPASVATDNDDQGEEGRALDVIVVTATKRGQGQDVQDVGAAITAFGPTQLEELEVRNLENLSFTIPNVQLNSIGTVPATANFSIRGLGVNSSIQSIEPTVGVFVDGMYLGSNVGVLFDSFDFAGIEVLRGPQGLLFGKNVTGGAVLLRTTEPSDVFQIDARASVETGPSYTASAVVTGPISANLSGKLAVYHNQDDGWFTNLANGDDYGGGNTTVVRGALRYEFAGGAKSTLRLEYGENNQTSEPPNQNRARYDKNTFDVEGSGQGFSKAEWKHAIWQLDIPVAIGGGVVTNIMAYRDVESEAENDIDSLREFLAAGQSVSEQRQFSNELRYFGTFGPVDLTTGLYYYHFDLLGFSGARFGDGVNQIRQTTSGGDQTSETIAAFANLDWHVTDEVTLNLGVRYTDESKDARVSSFREGGCDLPARTCAFDFADSFSRSNISPKIGVQWEPSPDSQFYAFYTRGYRSGSYNFRPNSNTTVAVGPTDDEVQDAYEAGFKIDLAEGRARLNGALFYNKISDLQREVIVPDPGGPSPTSQTFRNTADAVIQGAEIEATILATDSLTLTAQAGITDGYYTNMYEDLTRDGVINSADLNLKLPRLSPLSFGASARYVWELENSSQIAARVDFNHRDTAPVNDSNTAFYSAADMLGASVSWESATGLTVSLYGRNLLNDVTEGFISPLPAIYGGPGATQAPLNKGRVVGLSVRYSR